MQKIDINLGTMSGLQVAEEIEGTVRALRLAQQLAKGMRASEVPPEEWGIVLKFLEVLAQKGVPLSDDEGPQMSAEESDPA